MHPRRPPIAILLFALAFGCGVLTHALSPGLALAESDSAQDEAGENEDDASGTADTDAESDTEPVWRQFEESLVDARTVEIEGRYEIELGEDAITIVKEATGDHRWTWWGAIGGGIVLILLSIFYFDESMRVFFGIVGVLLIIVGTAQLTQHRRVVVDGEAEEIVIADVRLWGLWDESETIPFDDIDGLSGSVYTEYRGSSAKGNRTVSTYNGVTAYVRDSDEQIELVDLPLSGEEPVVVKSESGDVLFEGEIIVTTLSLMLAEAFGERLEMSVR